jgi:hypothetical protein
LLSYVFISVGSSGAFVSKRIRTAARILDGRCVGATTIKQADYGIQPISALGGAVKVKNQLKIDFVIKTK